MSKPKLPDKVRNLALNPMAKPPSSEFLISVADRLEFLQDALTTARLTLADYGVEWNDKGKITKSPTLVPADTEMNDTQLHAEVRKLRGQLDNARSERDGWKSRFDEMVKTHEMANTLSNRRIEEMQTHIDGAQARVTELRVNMVGAHGKAIAIAAELLEVAHPFVHLSDAGFVQLTTGGFTLTRSDVKRLVRFASDPGAAVDLAMDVLEKAQAWVDGRDPERGASNDLDILRPYTEKMRRLASELENAVDARRVSLSL